MLKHTARFAAFALLMFAASAPSLTVKASSTQFDCPCPYPPVPPTQLHTIPLALSSWHQVTGVM